MKSWQPPPREPWGLESQLSAAGLEVPSVTYGGDALSFLRGRLFVHRCRSARCDECVEAARVGYRTLRVTKEEIGNGVALDKVGGALWAGEKQRGLF